MGWYPAMCSLCYRWLNCSLNDLNDCIIFIILTLLFCSNLILEKLDKKFHKSVSPPLTSSKKIINRGYMGNWTKYMWTNPKYCNTEAKNTLDARCISIQCWYDRSNIFWKKLVFPLILCVQRHLVSDNKPGYSKVFVYIAKLSPNVTEQCYVVWTSLLVANVLR